jgi:predicted helicase
VDKRIKETFVRNGKAQNQIILYDMYVRFYAWAMDRVDKNGVVAFITNRSFIESKAFDGFRKVMQQEFTHLYIVDLKGDIRQNNYAEQGGNVFNIMTGVAITFFVKVEEDAGSKAKIYYYNVGDAKTGKEKLEILKDMTFKKIPFEKIQPDTKHNWLKQTDNDFEKLLPLIDKEVKAGKKQKAIFKLFSLGVASHRDNWVYDLSKENLEEKMKFFVNIYQKTLKNSDFHSKNKIAWDADLENHCKRKIMKSFEKSKIKKCLFRPFVSKYHYFDRHFNGRLYQWKNIYQDEGNLVIAVNREGSNKPFHCLASNQIIDLHTTGDSQCLPFYYYENGERQDNITDWALELFRNKYGSAVAASPADALDNKLLAGASTTEKAEKKLLATEKAEEKLLATEKAEEKLLATEKAEEKLLAGSSTTAKVSEITKLDIFHYVYAVLHSPDYRKKYELDLKREFPRIPLYEDFWKYAEAGRRLMELHLNYESPQKMSSFLKDDIFTPLLERKDMELAKFLEKLRGKKKEKELFSKEKTTLIEEKVKEPEIKVNPILKIKDGNIEIDELTTLCGVPAEALAYKLGNRSAIEWVLEQYKPYKSDDKTIQEQFNNYNFEDYKEQVIDLLQKVTWVSVETMKIVKNL